MKYILLLLFIALFSCSESVTKPDNNISIDGHKYLDKTEVIKSNKK